MADPLLLARQPLEVPTAVVPHDRQNPEALAEVVEHHARVVDVLETIRGGRLLGGREWDLITGHVRVVVELIDGRIAGEPAR